MCELDDEIDERELRTAEFAEEHDLDRIPTAALSESRTNELAEAKSADRVNEEASPEQETARGRPHVPAE